MKSRFWTSIQAAALGGVLLSGCSEAGREPARAWERPSDPAPHRPSGLAARADSAPAVPAPPAAGSAPPAADPPAVRPQPKPRPRPRPDLRLEVNLAERELYVYRRGERVATYPVAVGSREWPTPTGEWTIAQVIWNPRWIPPRDESWAEDEDVSEPGAPGNPLGRAQLVYRAPNSIHGTTEPGSLGKAVSHGSIRVSNRVALRLARQITQAGGAGKSEEWYDRAEAERRVRREVLLPSPIPIRVVAGEQEASDRDDRSSTR
jgi:lipoprotein-anchoring transpeptidase ErfK/SrfK